MNKQCRKLVIEQNIKYVRRETSKAVEELNYAIEFLEERGEKVPQAILDSRKVMMDLHNNIINCVGFDSDISEKIMEE